MQKTLEKKRSRSETRQNRISIKSRRNRIDDEIIPATENITIHNNQPDIKHHQIRDRMKKSTEIVNEARTLLARVCQVCPSDSVHIAPSVGGLRLVSTRRPVTPRESRRALYGKVSMAGRPPSAFSLTYLQNTGNRSPLIPSLEPILNENSLEVCNSKDEHCRRLSRRWHSLDSRIDACDNTDGKQATVLDSIKIPRKLPALEIKTESMIEPEESNAKKVNDRHSARTSPARTGVRRASHGNVLKNKVINSLTSQKLLIRSFDLLVQSSTEKLIQLLKEHSGLKDCTDETVNHIKAILDELYMRVYKNEKLFKRGFILGGLYGLVESTSPTILLAVARVVLALRVTGSNLTGACKLIFKVARNEQNDSLFHDNDLLELLIDGLGHASPLDDPEACIYGYGSIRFLTCTSLQERAETNHALNEIKKNWMDSIELPIKPATAPVQGHDNNQTIHRKLHQKLNRQNSLVERLARHGAVELMVLHLQILNEAGAVQQLKGPPLHSLYQLSAALRALADVRLISSSFDINAPENPGNPIDTKPKSAIEKSMHLELACPHLIRAAEISIGELEVQSNIVRTLSVLSEDADCCKTILNFTNRLGMLLGPCCESLKENVSSEKVLTILSRLGYILGNIMAKSDAARTQFFLNDAAMDYLINILMLCCKKPLTTRNYMGDSVGDVLIKMVRVVANMSVNTEVGFGMGNTRVLGEILLDLLMASGKVKHINLRIEMNELAQATLGALHNLCFYQEKSSTLSQINESDGSLRSLLDKLAISLSIALTATADTDIKLETVRVLGNLTRNYQARMEFCKANGLAIILQIVDKALRTNTTGQTNCNLMACAIGVLVNLLGDHENRLPFIHMRGEHTLTEILRYALHYEDWFLASITCQAFWNLLMDVMDLFDLINPKILDNLSDILTDYLDEEIIYQKSDTPNILWEEFALVATDLLETLQITYEQSKNAEGNRAISNLNENDDDDVCVNKI